MTAREWPVSLHVSSLREGGRWIAFFYSRSSKKEPSTETKMMSTYFKDLIDKIMRELSLGTKKLKRAGNTKNLRTQEISLPIFRKSSKEGRRVGWLNKNLRCNKEMQV